MAGWSAHYALCLQQPFFSHRAASFGLTLSCNIVRVLEFCQLALHSFFLSFFVFTLVKFIPMWLQTFTFTFMSPIMCLRSLLWPPFSSSQRKSVQLMPLHVRLYLLRAEGKKRAHLLQSMEYSYAYFLRTKAHV